jgi:hypothetical protein
MIEIPTKWEYIRDHCENSGLKEAAKIADEIDKLLLEVYLTIPQTTTMWDDAYATHLIWYDDIEDIIVARSYCIGCQETDREKTCESCKFYKAGGYALYHKFRDVYYYSRKSYFRDIGGVE